MKKRAVKKAVAIILTVVLVLNTAFIGCFIVTNRYDSSVVVDKQARTITSAEEKVKILVLSDLQFSNYLEMSWAFAAAKRTVALADPDLILTTGDNFGNDVSLRHLRAFVRFMDSFGIPWGVVFGNHDYNARFSMGEYADACANSENGIFYSEIIDDSYSNYTYKLNVGGKDASTLVFMDTKKDGLTEKHTEWYEEKITANKSPDGTLLPSLVFFHIPLKESEYAADAYASDPSIGNGNISDEVRGQGTESGFFEKALELGSTKAIFYGHDHRNNAHISYRGIELCYAMKTGITVYFKPGSLGGVLIELDSNGEYTIERVYI